MTSFLRILWPIIAFILFIGLILKFILATVLAESSVAMILPILGVLFCLYLIFMLEGMQVAGIKIKDLDNDAIERFLTENSAVGKEKVMPVYKVFNENFDGFVTGRQVFIIMTVISLGTLISMVELNPDRITAETAGAGIITPLVEGMNHKYFKPIFTFAASTLIPAWLSQLLSQFLADKSAINFIGIPGARLVLSMAMFLDKIKIGEPAKVMMRWVEGNKFSSSIEHIPLGKLAFYDASVNFYGRAKQQQNILIDLNSTSTVKEEVTYRFKRGKTEYLDHAIHLSEPIIGNLKGRIDLPETVVAEFEAHDTKTKTGYLYWIRISLNQPLPLNGHEYDEANLVIQYQTKSYTTDNDASQTLQYATQLPTEEARITLIGKEKLLRQPKVAIMEIEGNYGAISNTSSALWSVTTPGINNNQTEIVIDHPTVGTNYQIEFEAMNAESEIL